MKLKPCVVEWFDAFADADNWIARDDLDSEPRLIQTCGWLLPPTIKKHYSVALCYDPEIDHVGSVIHIPKVNVRTIYKLTKSE